jgi:hypothetical protein
VDLRIAQRSRARLRFHQIVMAADRGSPQLPPLTAMAGIMDDEPTHEMLTFAHEQGIPAVDLAYELSTDAHWNLPHGGGHPRPLADRTYAERLQAFLRHEGLTHARAPADRAAR